MTFLVVNTVTLLCNYGTRGDKHLFFWEGVMVLEEGGSVKPQDELWRGRHAKFKEICKPRKTSEDALSHQTQVDTVVINAHRRSTEWASRKHVPPYFRSKAAHATY